MPNNNLQPPEPERYNYELTYSDGGTRTVTGAAVMAIGDGGYEFYADPADYYGVPVEDLKPMATAPAGATLRQIRDPNTDHEAIPALSGINGAEMPEFRDDGSPVLHTDNMTDPFGLLKGND